MAKNTILFLCTGNSCRSQIAEAIVNANYHDDWQGFSAGTNPAGYIHPFALKTLEEIGISHQGESKHLDTFTENEFDLVITVCDDASNNCPIWLRSGKLIHLPFPDPAKATGSDEEILSVFNQVRDGLTLSIKNVLSSYKKSNNTLS